MTVTQVKVKLAPEGNLDIPFAITRQAGFSPDEEAVIIVTGDGLFVRREEQVPIADDVLQALLGSGEIRLSDLGDDLRVNLVPGITLESVHEVLAGICAPIEEMIHEEREKYEA